MEILDDIVHEIDLGTVMTRRGGWLGVAMT